ncbi:hypothetical protein EVAR_52117_1 [Eumeta japonica]|uniref:Uncharacterized protein n=1 Tax=Eumeta variegata TaxID=151549 RepID=A0A4C1XQK9_EUMVA|nr:hypothetical protein EVAR_52117_1 [Eumeta japonica]
MLQSQRGKLAQVFHSAVDAYQSTIFIGSRFSDLESFTLVKCELEATGDEQDLNARRGTGRLVRIENSRSASTWCLLIRRGWSLQATSSCLANN